MEAGEPGGVTATGAAPESPFVTIWEAPRATIRNLVATDPRRHVNALFFLSGVVGTLTTLVRSTDQFTLPLGALPLLAVGSGLVNIPLGHLNAWYKRWVGGLLGGPATRQAVTTVGAWSSVPVIVGHGAVLAIQVALYGLEPFTDEQPTIDAAAPLLGLVLVLASALCSVWSAVISIVGFAEVNGFTIARSIGTSLLAIAILGVATLVVGFVTFVAFGRYLYE